MFMFISDLIGDPIAVYCNDLEGSDVNKDLTCKAKAKAKDQTGKDKAKAKDLSVKAKAKAKDLVPKAKDLPIW